MGEKNTVEVKAKIVPNQFISYRYAVNMVGGKPDVPELSKENKSGDGGKNIGRTYSKGKYEKEGKYNRKRGRIQGKFEG
jgi:hypothetical protein